MEMPKFKMPDLSKVKDIDFKNLDYIKLAKDFWYGKPHGERRIGDLYEEKTGLYKHREWRGVKDTFYYFNMPVRAWRLVTVSCRSEIALTRLVPIWEF